MSNVAQIQVELDLDNGKFTGKVSESGVLIRRLGGELDRAANSLRNIEARTTSFSSQLRGMVVTIDHTQGAIRALWGVTGSWVGDIAKAGGELERMRALMAGLSREIDPFKKNLEASKGFDFLIGMAQKTPFQLAALTDTFVKFKSAGLDPMDGSMKALADSVARFGGNSETLHHASIAIQQMAGKGVISMEELRRQLGEAVPDAMQRMADGLGLSMAELVKKISTGTVEAKSALTQMFFQMKMANDGASEDMMKTWTGMLAKLDSQIMLMKDNVFRSGLGDALKAQVQQLEDFLASSEGRQMAAALGQSLAGIVTELGNLFTFMRQNWDTIKTTGEILIFAFGASKLTNAIVSIGQGITGLIGQVRKYAMDFAASQARINAQYLQSARLNAELTAQGVAQKAAAAAAEKIADTGRLANGRFVSQTIIQMKRAEAAAYAEAALASEAQAAAVARSAAITRTAATAMEVALGPIGWITLALTAGITAWSLWGGAAEDAMQKARDAVRKGFATADDLKTLQKNIMDANGEMRQLVEFMKENEQELQNPNLSADRRNALKEAQVENIARMKELGIQMLKVNGDYQDGLHQVEEEGIRDSLAIIERGTRDKLGEINRQNQAEIIAAKEALTEKLKNGELNDKTYHEQWTATQRLLYGKRAQLQQTFLQSELDSTEAAYKAIGDKNSVEGRKLSAQIDALNTKLKEVSIDAKSAAGVGDADFLSPKGPKKDPKGDAFRLFLENLQGDIAKTKEQVNGLDGAWEKFLAQYDNGKGKFGVLSQQQLDFVKRLTEADAEATAQLKKHKEAEAALKSVQDDRVKIQGRLTSDMASLKMQASGDVFSSVSGGMVQLNRQLQEMSDNLDKAGKGWGVARLEFDQFAASARAQQSAIDAIKFGQDMKEIRDKANASLITSNRERARAELQIEIDKINRSIELERKAGADEVTIAQMTSDARMAIMARTAQFEHDTQPAWKKLLEGWSNLSENMEQVWANSMQGMSDHLNQFVETGKLDFKGLMIDILKEIERALMNKAIAAFANMIMSMFGGGAGATASFSGSSYTGNMTGYANGGVMTPEGNLPLKKYASGGIANSPQLALFGEGRLPEAYVPLPDGRRIPVNMQGHGATTPPPVNVQVNVINQSGHEVQAEQRGQRFDGEQMVLDVVLSAASRPGKFRDGMRAGLSR